MENKYYTPDIEEFHVGFEYENVEIFETEWKIKKVGTKIKEYKNIFSTWLEWKEDDCNTWATSYRVKYLDKEDIESLGFIQTGNMSDGQEAEYQLLFDDTEDFYMITRDFDNQYEITYEKSTGINMSTCFTLFSGKIKNKSELKKILQQVGVRIKNNKE